MFDNLEDPELLFSALQHLRHNKHEVILFHVVDRQKELDFDFDQRPYRFVDLETGEKLKLLPDEVRDKYRQQLYEYKEQLKLRCARFKVDFIEADIHQGFDQVLLPYFLKRSRLY
jgi:uncharacterized protein (DUF58 family)